MQGVDIPENKYNLITPIEIANLWRLYYFISFGGTYYLHIMNMEYTIIVNIIKKNLLNLYIISRPLWRNHQKSAF